MVANPQRLLMSVEEYLILDRTSLENRYEYIDGVVSMFAGGTGNHSVIAANMIRDVSFFLRGKPCRVYTSDMRVKISKSRYVYPDITVSCDERDRGAVEMLQYPHLIVEVLSPGTEAYDRGRKFSYYRSLATLQEYVLVDAQRQAIDVFRRQNDNLWLLSPFGPDGEVELKSLDMRLPVAVLYEDVIFPEDSDTK